MPKRFVPGRGTVEVDDNGKPLAPKKPNGSKGAAFAIHDGVHLRMPASRHPIQQRGTGVISDVHEDGTATINVYASSLMSAMPIKLPHISVAAPGAGWFVPTRDLDKYEEPPEPA